MRRLPGMWSAMSNCAHARSRASHPGSGSDWCCWSVAGSRRGHALGRGRLPRARRNEPLFVKHVAEKLAEIRGMTFEEIAQVTSANAVRLFGLGEITR